MKSTAGRGAPGSAGKSTASDFALLGGEPTFAQPIPVGQMNFPSWERYVEAMRGICEREWYTNHGPMAARLEAELADFFGVAHALCVTNATIGLMMAVKALSPAGEVILPAFAAASTAQSLVWSGVAPVFCDVDPITHHLTAGTVAAALTGETTAILGVNLWGDACDVASIEALGREHEIPVYFDSAHAAGCALGGVRLGGFGALEVFSLHATTILNATGGGCVTTDDAGLAMRLRNIRSSYGAGPPVPVPVTLNGRFSEMQAATALMSLEDFETHRERNRASLALYRDGLEGVPGVKVRRPSRAGESNYQYAVCEIEEEAFGLSRDRLRQVLNAENVDVQRPFRSGLHRNPVFTASPSPDEPERGRLPRTRPVPELPHTDRLCDTVLLLPLGQLVTEQDIRRIVDLVHAAHQHAERMRD